MDEIVKCKENIQPLRQGRNTEQLCEALSEVKQHKHVALMQQFEMRLRSYEGDDPLEPWHSYISWMEQTSTATGKKYKDVLKQCLKNFSGEAAYSNDARFIDLWFKYLSTQANRMELYETILGHGIGVNSANFYQRWASDLEAAGDLRGADKIFLRGLSEQLDQRDVLEQAHQRFQMRAAKTKPEEHYDTTAPQRAVLGQLESRDGKVAAERAQFRPLGANRPMEKPIKEQAAFPVFTGGENEKPRRQLMKELPDERARVENESAPCKWTEAASGRDVRPLTVTTPFKVLEDATEATPRTKLTISKRVLQEVKPVKKDADFPLAYFEPVNEKSKPMYCKDKVYCGGTEFSFEELRAETWRRRQAARAARLAREGLKKEAAPPARKEILMFETVRDGQEWSFEELRAKDYLAKLNAKWKCPVACFEPENPNQVRMYNKERVYADNTEYSPEELRAKDWVARSQSGLLCQSMTVHTKEALAAVQDLWHSSIRESPPPSPPRVAFNIYQDGMKGAGFEIYSDNPKPAPAPFAIFSDEGNSEPASVPFAIFADEPKPMPKPFSIFSDQDQSDGAVLRDSVRCNNAPFEVFSTKQEIDVKLPPDAENFRPVLQPRFEMMADDVKQEDDDQEDDEEEDEEPFEPKPLPPLPELPYVAPPDDWVPNGPEGKENFTPDMKKIQSDEFADDEDTQFVMGPLGVGPINSLEDVTVGLMKRPPPVCSSTPFVQHTQSLLNMQPQETRHTMLSPILEMTGESRGSRSGSSSSGASSASSKAFSFNLKTPGQSLVNEPTHHTMAPVKLDLLEEEEQISDPKEQSRVNIIENPWSQDLQRQLKPCVEGVQYMQGPMPVPRCGYVVHIGKKALKLKKCLGEGAYGKVYKAENSVVVKLIHDDTTAWELHISRFLRNRVPSHLMEHFCEVSAASVFSNGTILEMPLRSEINLLAAINGKLDMSDSTKAYLVHQILLVSEALFEAKIIHADIKPDNFILVPIRFGTGFRFHLQLIDFGRCINLNLLPAETSFTATLKGDNRCVAMRLQRPWSFDLDFYSAAATIHVVLFGKYLTLIDVKSTWKPTCKPKRFWQLASLYEKLLDDLINPTDRRIEFSKYLDPLLQYAKVDQCVVNEELDSVFGGAGAP